MTQFTPDDYQYMTQALRLAEQGLYTTMPNPRVGCVIVKGSQVVGQGVHLKVGTPHAEVHALNQAKQQAKGATAYVTLEPCSHQGRTPPCAQALIDAGLSKVVVAMQDPNPLVAGQGIQLLQSAGIQVEIGLLQTEATSLNPGFIKRMTKQRPLIRSKIAASLDGRTALSNGESKWITSEAARLDVQRWRARSCAILTGIGTVLGDDPSLTVRAFDIGRQPMTIIVDSHLRIPLDAKVLENTTVLIAHASENHEKIKQLASNSVQLLYLPNDDNKVCLKRLMAYLATLELNEVMVEGGEGLNGALISERLVDELLLYYAPKLMGSDAKGMFGIPALQAMQDVVSLDIIDIRQLSQDIRIHGKVKA